MPVPLSTKKLLIHYADQYEAPVFLCGDPSWFMHQVSGADNREAMAFIASCLSYGSRQQFMTKIQVILELTEGRVDEWVREGLFENYFRAGDNRCFYRLFSYDRMHEFLCAYQQLLQQFGTLGRYVQEYASDGFSAISAITRYFGDRGLCVVIPKDTQSACKRVCMFLRWMVRSNSPVDLGLWSTFIDRRTLIMPLDTHVLEQSVQLGLLKNKTATMATARRLTAQLSEIFPDDPLKADFALFGYGVDVAK